MSVADNDPLRRLEWALLHAQDSAARARLDAEDEQRRLSATMARLRLVEGSVSFRLGAALVEAVKSWRGLRRLPFELAALRSSRAPTNDAFVTAPEQPRSVDEIAVAHLLDERRQLGVDLSELRIAAVLDEFSHASFAPECRLVNLPVRGFESMLDEFAPHFLLVESAWRGSEDGWRHRICPLSSDLRYLVDCCRRRGIPTVFWNKEDPIHFDDFIEAAALFDHVFTTDADCIPRYADALGHGRVHSLAFCCQPRLHHPIETAQREAAACFAGSWYRFYSERSREFERIVSVVQKVLPVVIYDRNGGRADPDFAFPERYGALIKGTLSYDQIDLAYKGYQYAITINSVRNSPSMLARRVYELLACNTIVVSNPTLGLSHIFGDLAISGADDAIETELRHMVASPSARHKRRLLGLREVLSKHTAAHRLNDIARAAVGATFALPQADIVVVARAYTDAQAQALVQAYERQAWARKRLYLVLGQDVQDPAIGNRGATTLLREGLDELRIAASATGRWLAMLHPDDYYGPDYLGDLALATLYAPYGPIGKGRFFRYAQDGSVYVSGEAPYSPRAHLCLRAMIAPLAASQSCDIGVLLSAMESEIEPSSQGLAIDEFGYCRHGAGRDVSVVDVVAAVRTAREPPQASGQ